MTRREHHPPPVPPDPSGIEEPHDVLAAEEFGIGTRDERRPPDPSGIRGPHDVLAAEEFAMPAAVEPPEASGVLEARTLVPIALLTATIAFVLVRRLR